MESVASKYYNVSFESLVGNIFQSSVLDTFRRVDVEVTNGGLADTLFNSSLEDLHIVCSIFSVLSTHHFCVAHDARYSTLARAWISVSVELSHSSA